VVLSRGGLCGLPGAGVKSLQCGGEGLLPLQACGNGVPAHPRTHERTEPIAYALRPTASQDRQLPANGQTLMEWDGTCSVWLTLVGL
jgi:hypothetical protein